MGSNTMMKKAIGGSIHRIREFELEKVSLAEEFDLLQIVGEGWFGKILLVEHKATDTEMVLKALPKPYTALKDFYREFHYGLHLGAHRNVITTYDVAFETAGFYVFSQEYAPLGDLTSNVSETGIGELHTKRVARQLAAALEHLHTRDLVHRDVKLDNILVFKSDFSRVKLCDFGETRRSGSVVRRRNEWLPYAPPEVLKTQTDENYKAVTSHDVWQFGIVVFVCLTGCLPWQKAAMDDPRYCRYLSWHTSTMPIRRQPKLFKLVSSKAQRLFKKFLEPKPERRPANLADVHRFLEDRWMSKGGMEKNIGVSTEDDGLCPSMYSFHSSPEEKNKLLFTLTQYGIETTVDRGAKKDRIREWIQSSVIEEEDEAEGEGMDEDMTEEDVHIQDNQTGPPGERQSRGPIGDNRLKGKTAPSNQNATPSKPAVAPAPAAPESAAARRERRLSSLSVRLKQRHGDVYTPPIDPRIPLEQQKQKIASHVPNGGPGPALARVHTILEGDAGENIGIGPNEVYPGARPGLPGGVIARGLGINKEEYISDRDNFTATNNSKSVIQQQREPEKRVSSYFIQPSLPFQNIALKDASTQSAGLEESTQRYAKIQQDVPKASVKQTTEHENQQNFPANLNVMPANQNVNGGVPNRSQAQNGTGQVRLVVKSNQGNIPEHPGKVLPLKEYQSQSGNRRQTVAPFAPKGAQQGALGGGKGGPLKETDRFEAYRIVEKRSSSQSNSTGRSVSK